MRNSTVTTHVRFRRHAGFSFAEVMFAVMLLGLGFIMVAAIFPVAIRQQTASMEDTSGVAVAKRGAAVIRQMGVAFAQYDNPTGTYKGLTQVDLTATTPHMSKAPLIRFQATPSGGGTIPYNYVKGDMIQQSDRRFAWVPVAYQSALGAEYAQVYLVAVQSRVNEQFTDADRDNSASTGGVGPFVPVDCYFKLVEGDTLPDTIVFTDASGNPLSQDLPAVAEGAFLWVENDQVTSTPAGMPWIVPGAANGHYYRLGVKRDDLGASVWELQPGNDMTITTGPGLDNQWGTADDEKRNENLPPRAVDSQPVNYAGITGSPAVGLLVGRGRNATGNYAGINMALFAHPPVTVGIKP